MRSEERGGWPGLWSNPGTETGCRVWVYSADWVTRDVGAVND